MSTEKNRESIERMLKNCPELMTPMQLYKWSIFGKNHIYWLINTGELRSFVYRGAHIITKEDYINYLLEHCEDAPVKHYYKKGAKQ